ncbi:MAG TPA: ATP-binding protein [Polyangiales bacterium]|nr:ATP-binding protein [Polyangiales bacterium]
MLRSDSPYFSSASPSLGLATLLPTEGRAQHEESWRAAELLIGAMRDLSRARTRAAVADVVKTCARKLVGADGATFVLRDGVHCFYLDEDAISPLWKGQRFPLSACVSGWVMEHAAQVVMPDIYQDARVPHEAYRPTFVKSLVMTPVRRIDPVAAIGIYWADYHQATERECELLQNLADTTAVALENATVYEELEQRVHERTQQLQQANLELESFSHTVAHDLRSPLNAIIGFAELLAERNDSPAATVHSFSTEIANAGRRMNNLIGVLLEFARDAAVEVNRAPLDVSTMANEAAGQLRLAGAYADATIEIEPGLEAFADASLLEVALTNLLSNALKYSAKSPAPRVKLGAHREDGGATVYYVCDNGAGFDPSRADRLFLPFQRLHDPREYAGNGVGLATVARVVRRHGGRIWAEGAPGEGATFYFTLPTPT